MFLNNYSKMKFRTLFAENCVKDSKVPLAVLQAAVQLEK